jgi:transcription initiation factor TFIIE subunit alpha
MKFCNPNYSLQEFKCTFCGSTVEEDESAMPKKDSRLMLAKFNEQMEKVNFAQISV